MVILVGCHEGGLVHRVARAMRRLVSLNGVNALPNGKVAGYLSLSSGGRRSPTMEKTPFGRVERLAEAKEKASRVRAGQVGSGG